MPKPNFFIVARRFAKIVAVSLLLTGCTYSYTKDVTHTALQQLGWRDQAQVTRARAHTLPIGTRVYVVYPSSSAEVERSVPRFRSQLQLALAEVSRSRGLESTIGQYQQTLPEALNDAQVNACDFLFSVVVTNLEAGAESIKDNQGFQLFLNVYDVRAQRLLETIAVVVERGTGPVNRSPNALIYSSATAVIERLYTPPRS